MEDPCLLHDILVEAADLPHDLLIGLASDDVIETGYYEQVLATLFFGIVHFPHLMKSFDGGSGGGHPVDVQLIPYLVSSEPELMQGAGRNADLYPFLELELMGFSDSAGVVCLACPAPEL